MKGVVFTSFLELVEQKFGYEVVDKILSASDLPSGGIYTSIGTYKYSEMVSLLDHLSRHTGIPVPDLLYLYGQYFFGVIIKTYSYFLKDIHSSFDLLSGIDNYIHVEVQKLYPDAELPSFVITNHGPDKIEMVYRSARKMGDFAAGLIQATLEHYGEKANVLRENLDETGAVVRFVIERYE
jgi:hypothetical protein